MLFSVEEGGQTEWRWGGRGGVVGRGVRERNDRCCLVHSRMHPVRGAGLGREGRFGRVSQAVRPAGKRMRDDNPAEVFIVDNHGFTGGLALGMEAEMIFGAVM